MEHRLLEVRDLCTTIPVLAFRFHGESDRARRLIDHGGFGGPDGWDRYVFLMPMDEIPRVAWNHRDWEGRTFPAAHRYIAENFDDLIDGDVVDVEYVLGEVSSPKPSQFA